MFQNRKKKNTTLSYIFYFSKSFSSLFIPVWEGVYQTYYKYRIEFTNFFPKFW